MISHPNAVVQVHSQLSFNSHNPSFGKICRDENRVVRRQFPELRLLPSFLPPVRTPLAHSHRSNRTRRNSTLSSLPPSSPCLPCSLVPSSIFLDPPSIVRPFADEIQSSCGRTDGRTDTGGRRRAPSPAPDCLKSEALYLCWRGEQRRRGYCNDDRSVRPRDPGLF